ncbi:MAG: caspase family protein [Bacteroidales bacterium]|nr:caspase family protein [Bacteroidales bacterium]
MKIRKFITAIFFTVLYFTANCQEHIITEKKKIELKLFYALNSSVPINSECLDSLTLMISDVSYYEIHIECNTCSIGSTDYNKKLSSDRCANVKKSLIDAGLDSASMYFLFFGESKPLYSNKIEEERRKNRRSDIEITIFQKTDQDTVHEERVNIDTMQNKDYPFAEDSVKSDTALLNKEDDSVDLPIPNKINWLLLGINNYQNGINKLNFALNDALSIASCAGKNKIMTNTNVLSETISKRNIIKIFKEYSDSSKENEIFVFFYSGHGSENNIVLSDGSYLSYEQLAFLLSKFKGNIVVIFDCCFSGEAVRSFKKFWGGKLGGITYNIINKVKKNNFPVTLSSSSSDEVSKEERLYGGYFTCGLKKGIENGNADYNKDGVLSLNSELFPYAQEIVRDISDDGQNPVISEKSNNLLIFKY